MFNYYSIPALKFSKCFPFLEMFKMFIRGLCLGIKIKIFFRMSWNVFLNGVEVPVFGTYIYVYITSLCDQL